MFLATTRPLELQRRSNNWGWDYTRVITSDQIYWKPSTRTTFSEPVPLRICPESQLTPADFSAGVKLARNNKSESRRYHYRNQSCLLDLGKDWVLTYSNTEVNSICYYLTIMARLCIIRKLTGTSSLAIINHGIPSQLITGNGSQYNCLEFCQFAKAYGTEHITSSLLDPQSNGFEERVVQTVKNTLCSSMLRKEKTLPWNTFVQNNTRWPPTKVTRGTFRATLPTPPVLTDIKSKKAFTKAWNNRPNSTRTGLRYHHYHRYTTVNTCTHVLTFQDVAAGNNPGTDLCTYSCRCYTVQSSTTGTVYRRTRSQHKPDTAFSDYGSKQELPVSYPTPSDQDRGQPGQPVVELTDKVTITRCSPTPDLRSPEPIAMATAGHEHGYVTRSRRVVKPNIKLSLWTLVTNSAGEGNVISCDLIRYAMRHCILFRITWLNLLWHEVFCYCCDAVRLIGRARWTYRQAH